MRALTIGVQPDGPQSNMKATSKYVTLSRVAARGAQGPGRIVCSNRRDPQSPVALAAWEAGRCPVSQPLLAYCRPVMSSRTAVLSSYLSTIPVWVAGWIAGAPRVGVTLARPIRRQHARAKPVERRPPPFALPITPDYRIGTRKDAICQVFAMPGTAFARVDLATPPFHSRCHLTNSWGPVMRHAVLLLAAAFSLTPVVAFAQLNSGAPSVMSGPTQSRDGLGNGAHPLTPTNSLPAGSENATTGPQSRPAYPSGSTTPNPGAAFVGGSQQKPNTPPLANPPGNLSTTTVQGGQAVTRPGGPANQERAGTTVPKR